MNKTQRIVTRNPWLVQEKSPERNYKMCFGNRLPLCTFSGRRWMFIMTFISAACLADVFETKEIVHIWSLTTSVVRKAGHLQQHF